MYDHSCCVGKQPVSTASKAPASTVASKAPKAEDKAKKTAKKTSTPAAADGEKKKRRKARKETYSSYIYKGEYRPVILVTGDHV